MQQAPNMISFQLIHFPLFFDMGLLNSRTLGFDLILKIFSSSTDEEGRRQFLVHLQKSQLPSSSAPAAETTQKIEQTERVGFSGRNVHSFSSPGTCNELNYSTKEEECAIEATFHCI
jgi:hypothetical protein